jgi:hypothetical protein
MNKTKIKQDKNAKKLKHIKYTKLSPISSETIPSPVELSFCRTSKNPRGIGLAIFRLLFDLIGSLESPPSNLWKATRKPDQLVLSEIHE